MVDPDHTAHAAVDWVDVTSSVDRPGCTTLSRAPHDGNYCSGVMVVVKEKLEEIRKENREGAKTAKEEKPDGNAK